MDKDVLNELKKELPTIYWKFREGKKDFLLKYCKRYHEIELRNIFYLISQKIISEKSGDMDTLNAIAILVLTWNWDAYYRTRKEKVKTIDQDILNAYNEYKSRFEKMLSDKKLETIDLDNEEIARAVGNAFDIFADRLDPVGASKALHTIKPDLFVMWDNKIQNEYRFQKQVKGVYIPLNGEAYIHFLRFSQEIAKITLQEISLDELRDEHYSQLEQSEKQLLDRFLCKEALPKMLDEANYAYVRSKPQ